MASQDLYDMFFEWPSTEPNQVIVTGTFDQWQRTKSLHKTARGFVGTVRVPWGEKVKYKFVVDGKWLTLKGQPTEMDPGGYINNVFTTPVKPSTSDTLSQEAPVPQTEEVKEELAVSTASEVAVVSPPEAEVSTIPEVPVVTVPAGDDAVLSFGSGAAVVSPEPAPDVPVVIPPEKEGPAVAISSGSEAAAVSPPEVETSTTARMPIVFVPLNSTEHNTIGSSQVPPPPDYVLPPSSRAASGITSTIPHVTTSGDNQPPVENSTLPASKPVEGTPVELSAIESEIPADQAQNELTGLQAPAEIQAQQAEEALKTPEASTEQVAKPLADSSAKERQEMATQNEQEAPHLNGTPSKTDTSENAPSPSASSSSKQTTLPALPSIPSTPPKKGFSFPHARSPSSRSVSSSLASPKSGTVSSRKKRTSFFGKIKQIFHHDHDKDEGKTEKEK